MSFSFLINQIDILIYVDLDLRVFLYIIKFKSISRKVVKSLLKRRSLLYSLSCKITHLVFKVSFIENLFIISPLLFIL